MPESSVSVPMLLAVYLAERSIVFSHKLRDKRTKSQETLTTECGFVTYYCAEYPDALLDRGPWVSEVRPSQSMSVAGNIFRDILVTVFLDAASTYGPGASRQYYSDFRDQVFLSYLRQRCIMAIITEKIKEFRALVSLLVSASEEVIDAWQAADEPWSKSSPSSDTSAIPSHKLYNARRTILGAIGQIVDYVQEPRSRCMELASQHLETRAFHIAVEKRIPDLLKGADVEEGVGLEVLGLSTGIHAPKLGRLLRALCSISVFREVRPGYFSNNNTSACLVGNEGLRAWIVAMSWDAYAASLALPAVLYDPIKTNSSSDTDTAFNYQFKTSLSRWQWLEEPVIGPDGATTRKPELEIFGLAMVGGGRALGPPLYVDYPWADLGSATIVDVGGGIGGMSLDLAKQFPLLRFVVQDRPHVTALAETLWKREMPKAIEMGRVEFMTHDFFEEQPIRGAEVYLMRYIMHDWDDEKCLQILTRLKLALTNRSSRILISDQVIVTTAPAASDSVTKSSQDAIQPTSIAPELKGQRTIIHDAPSPLLRNYGYASRFKHMRDLSMMTLMNGRERTLEEWVTLFETAGLSLEKVWECRGVVWILEVRK